jgi:hypothetical protein
MSDFAELRRKEQSSAEDYCRKAGYKSGGGVKSDAAQDRASIAGAVHKHERHDHPGEPLTKLRGGGKVGGSKAKPRLDRFARGGKVGKGPINIIISTGGGEPERQMAFQQGAKVGAAVGGAAGAPRPPMMPPPGGPGMPPPGAGMPPGGPPPMAGPMAPAMAGVPPMARPPMKRGGSVKVNTVGGSESGIGRLEKSGMDDLVPVKAHARRRAGGRV